MQLSRWLDTTFPQRKIPNITYYYYLSALTNLWFLSGNWIFYWLRFMTYGQLGIVDALCFLFGLVMEVPSGAIADMIGKRRAVIAAMAFSSIGFVFMGTATSLPALWIGFLFFQAGLSFYSGAAEALAYDTLVDAHQENEFEKVISTSGSVITITTVLSTLLGGLMYTLHYRSPHLGMAVGFAIAWVIALKLREPHVDTEKFHLHIWWDNLVDGTRQLFIPILQPFLIVILVLMGTEFIYEWGFLKPAIAASFGFMDKQQAIIFALLGIINGLLVRALPTLRRHVSDKTGLYLLTFIIGVAYLLSSRPLGYFGLIPMMMFALSSYLVYPWISVVVNKEIQPKHRATTLSAVALLTKIPYVLTAILAGKMIERGNLWLFNLVVGLVILVAMGINALISRRHRPLLD